MTVTLGRKVTFEGYKVTFGYIGMLPLKPLRE